MAALLNHGLSSPIIPQTHLHLCMAASMNDPFQNSLVKQSNATQADSTRGESEPHVRSITNHRDTSSPAPSQGPYINTHSSSNVVTRTTQPTAQEEHDVDSDSDRRKRRKLTPCTELYATGNVAPDADSVRTSQTMEPAHEMHSSHHLLAGIHSEAASAPPAIHHAPISPAPASESNLPAEYTLVGTKSPRSTPRKKKMMKLTTGGKLASSPKNKVSQSDVANTSVVPKARSIKLKKGQIVPSLKVILPYRTNTGANDSARVIAQRINEILAGQYRLLPQVPEQTQGKVVPQPAPTGPAKTTHPFFLAKTKARRGSASSFHDSSAVSQAQDSETEARPASTAPKPWSEIVFKSKRTAHTREIYAFDPIWPPLDLQHIQPMTNVIRSLPLAISSSVGRSSVAKSKGGILQVPVSEDILKGYGSMLSSKPSDHFPIILPQRALLSGAELCKRLEQQNSSMGIAFKAYPQALKAIQVRALKNRSAFDRGAAAGPLAWAQEYAPKRAEEVLQPHAHILQEWLEKLKVHNVRSGTTATDSRSRPRVPKKKRLKKKVDDLDDFIVSSDDETVNETAVTKNAILICGPSGCGKTASVYAVAQELGFEIFEIHAGMRRSAKDIFDKVGDMTQNHLVQQSNPLSQDSSMLVDHDETASANVQVTTGTQQSIGGFITGSKKPTSVHTDKPDASKGGKNKTQKQSLILFEEVDNLFEDDKAFWFGVQSLIQQSKRPVILTCNNIESVPVQELDLYTILLYDHPPADVAAAYLSYVAAAEGHLVENYVIEGLYKSKGYDLRATLTELNLWCQMGVGSTLGGLDWMPRHSKDIGADYDGNPRRIVSCGTFSNSLDLVPSGELDEEDLLRFMQESLDIPLPDFLDVGPSILQDGTDKYCRLEALDASAALFDAKSCMDLADESLLPMFGAALSRRLDPVPKSLQRRRIIDSFLQQRVPHRLKSRRDMIDTLAPIMEDNRTFPPPTGRTAASIDGGGQPVVTEVAPYVRAIVAFDQRLEQQRNELSGSSQGKKVRTTRAARAALEGGAKALTRREKWFPKELDFSAVMRTGGSWPQFVDIEEDLMSSPPDSTQSTVVEMEDS